jgi:hypothetical protein
VLAYLASYFDRKTIALAAGMVGTLALVLASLAGEQRSMRSKMRHVL